MNKIYLFLFLVIFLVLDSCENNSVVETSIEHKEYIVVQSTLKKDSTFSGVSIKRTLSLNEIYSDEKAEVQDAEGYLKINGAQIIPLHYSAKGIYKPLYNLKIDSGKTYELYAKVSGKSVYSKTLIPGKPVVRRALYQNNFFITVNIIPKQDEAYGAAWIIGGENSGIYSDDFYSVLQGADLNQLLSLRTKEIPEEYRTSFYVPSTYVKIYAFDSSFEDYFKTKDNNKPIDNSLTQGGGLVAWNVYGEDVIGLFIGMAEGDLIKPQ